MEKCEDCFLVYSFYECLLKKKVFQDEGLKFSMRLCTKAQHKALLESDKSELLSATR